MQLYSTKFIFEVLAMAIIVNMKLNMKSVILNYKSIFLKAVSNYRPIMDTANQIIKKYSQREKTHSQTISFRGMPEGEVCHYHTR